MNGSKTDRRGSRPDALPTGTEPYDLLVIGGGIVGAGVARDAALRGLRTLLLEQSDFASGTSSRSSRLLHGGLRYLAQGRVGLVREASVEKMRLSKNAPHLSQPLPFLFPVWEKTGWSLWKLSLGVKIYDLLCGGRNLGASATYSKQEVLRHVPGLRPDGLKGATRHYDGLTNDARLVIDTLRSAEQAGATVRNYTSFTGGNPGDGGWTCGMKDLLTGEVGEVRARSVVNAAGAWASRIPNSGVKLRLTKGVHAVIDGSRLVLDQAIVLPEGKRILFVIPWGERVILGTTDTDYEGDPADVRTDASDIAYILGVVNGAFPKAKLVPEDVISSWAGVRPLIAPRHVKAGSPSDTSRNHEIRMAEPGWFDVAGGKLTTYRLMAEQAVDQVGHALGRRIPASRTADLPLAGGPFSGVLPPPIGADVVAECCRDEWAVHLDDVLLRRTSWHYYHADHAEIAERVARWMADQWGWDDDQVRKELARLQTATDTAPG
ncbi:glycerol-3-phosphate dehydrogenase/oxidase [Tundrisphaera sp. TA3]|uniref:glycerol-3-phosphate dehydrogenase/oxidase n=1 Tax=Tundrisphaera sp. TA3 TaxID=3435775 RepID=UPI003EB8F918